MDASEHETRCRELEQRLAHGFERPELLETALTHRSWSAERQQPELGENQRLEFLGDAVLGAIAAEWLVAHCPDWREGTLTKVRSRLTNEATLERVARKLGLGGHLRLGRGEEQSGGREKRAVLADALEAVIGALWLDGGADAVRRLFQEAFAGEIAEAVEAGGDDNPKGDLQERMQQEWKTSPRYETLEESGPPHARHFRVAVYRGEECLGAGEGASKREAEMNAARQALGSQ
jgi:ribonuclease III